MERKLKSCFCTDHDLQHDFNKAVIALNLISLRVAKGYKFDDENSELIKTQLKLSIKTLTMLKSKVEFK